MNIKDIKDPKFLKDLKPKELNALASDIRAFLVENISATGGHLASNLGVVELTIALHYVFNSPEDTIIFDVSHQSYVHKILTGRASEFDTLRQKGGISGYASYDESPHDKWESGHAGTSISAMMGYLYANKINNKNNHVISVVGDASIVNGTNMEALNLLGSDTENKGIIVLNDNKMSINKSVGAFSNMFSRLRGSKIHYFFRRVFDKFLPNFLWRIANRIRRSIKAIFQKRNIFEDMGYTYIGPIDGNNIKRVVKSLELAKRMRKSVVLHVITEKGLGYEHAELDTENFHGVEPFNVETGKSLNGSKKETWSAAISKIIDSLMEKHDIFVIMPAMLVGAKFLDFQKKYPNRILDVGIAEEHAASMSAALALNNINVFLPLYSTFSQRAYDQILNDIARPNLKVVIGIDRAGFVGEDGSTHQGLYDVSMFLSMPNIVVTMPRNTCEAYGLLNYAYTQENPFVIRYPRGEVDIVDFKCEPIKPSWEVMKKGKLAVISYGPFLNEIAKMIENEKLDVSLINARYIRPIDEEVLKEVAENNKTIIVYEQTHASGSLYQIILDFLARNNYDNKVVSMSAYNKVIDHGTVLDNLEEANLDLNSLLKTIKKHETR
ncbi:MAG: 1-deoxy-D-xylulose-5-phosphate synthase [Acholeplasmataceae bacterium]|jgi:1-deoxy-D-xylulose-5-phosphate synthase|nr:1-deoxy-D-xylulose-5-phosphate synthase [Acholeplasmataceae bacterium]